MEDGSGAPEGELTAPGYRPFEEGEVELPYEEEP
jgi:hypothetical protein